LRPALCDGFAFSQRTRTDAPAPASTSSQCLLRTHHTENPGATQYLSERKQRKISTEGWCLCAGSQNTLARTEKTNRPTHPRTTVPEDARGSSRPSRKQKVTRNYSEAMHAERPPKRGPFLFTPYVLLVAGGVAVPLEVFFELRAPCPYRATLPHAADLPAAQAPVDPALGHPKLLAQLRNRVQLPATALPFFLFSSWGRRDASPEMLSSHSRRALCNSIEGLVVGL
jgi:hypothetical protein